MTHDDDISPEDYKRLTRYFKRTGIFRVYRILRPPFGGTQLMLEFVIRGRVLFEVDLWKRKKGLFTEDE